MSAESFASQIGCKLEELKMLEAGMLHFKSGRLQQILRGYKMDLWQLLERYTVEKKTELLKQGTSFDESRWFTKRQNYYSLRLVANHRMQETPLFVAGDPSSYVWAVPMRRLKNDENSVEFLELAERRSGEPDRGGTIANAHPGSEIIYVIRGQVRQYIDEKGKGDFKQRPLSKGDLVHIDSSKPHYVENASDKLTAFLLVIRSPR